MLVRTLLAVATLLFAFSLAGAETGTVKASSQSATPKEERAAGTVEMYVTDWCGYCRKAEKYLKGRGIPYVAYDIEKDDAAARRHQALGGGGVPLIVVGSYKMSGFSPETLEYYLKKSK